MKVVSGCQYLYETLGNDFKQILNLPKHYVNKTSSEEVVPTKATHYKYESVGEGYSELLVSD